MTEHEASRTLVKSPPELWAECSQAASLARHLGEFGEIRITKLEPETAVAWEGDVVRGTVRLEPSGWGTRVILTAAESVEPEPVVEGEVPEPVVEAKPLVEAKLAGEEVGGEKQPDVAAPAGPPEAEQVRGLAEVLYDPAPPERAVATATATADRRERFFARLMRRLRGRRPRAASPELTESKSVADAPALATDAALAPQEPDAPVPVEFEAPAPVEPEPPAPEPLSLVSVLDSALESLGSAHHRPFSRA
jgi:hypothetical protein